MKPPRQRAIQPIPSLPSDVANAWLRANVFNPEAIVDWLRLFLMACPPAHITHLALREAVDLLEEQICELELGKDLTARPAHRPYFLAALPPDPTQTAAIAIKANWRPTLWAVHFLTTCAEACPGSGDQRAAFLGQAARQLRNLCRKRPLSLKRKPATKTPAKRPSQRKA